MRVFLTVGAKVGRWSEMRSLKGALRLLGIQLVRLPSHPSSPAFFPLAFNPAFSSSQMGMGCSQVDFQLMGGRTNLSSLLLQRPPQHSQPPLTSRLCPPYRPKSTTLRSSSSVGLDGLSSRKANGGRFL